jgi:hypothetical protein
LFHLDARISLSLIALPIPLLGIFVIETDLYPNSLVYVDKHKDYLLLLVGMIVY